MSIRDRRHILFAIFPAQLEDCKAALRFLRAHAADYHIDKNRVVVWGASGHLVALLGVTGRTREFDVGDKRGITAFLHAVGLIV